MWASMLFPFVYDIGFAAGHVFIEQQRPEYLTIADLSTWTYWNFVQLGISAVITIYYLFLMYPTFMLIITASETSNTINDSIMNATWSRTLFIAMNGFQFLLALCKIGLVGAIIG